MILGDLLGLLLIIEGVYSSVIPVNITTRYVNLKDNVTLPCQTSNVYWVWEGSRGDGSSVLSDGSLFLPNVTRKRSGIYVCRREKNDTDINILSFNLVVRGPPDPPENVTVHASTVVAIVMWHLHLDDEWEDSYEGPKTTLQLRYRLIPSNEWLHLPHHIAPNQGRVEIYALQPNSTYEFQLWTKNDYGTSDIVAVNGTTLHDVAEIELARMLEENMDGFSPRVWIVAVVVVLVVITVSGLYLLIDHCQHHRFSKSGEADDCEGIELVPNIIENPGYQTSQNFEAAIHESLLMTSSSAVSHSQTALV